MRRRIVMGILLIGFICMLLPLSNNTSAEKSTEMVPDAELTEDREVKVYYIDTEAAENLLEDTWILKEYQGYCYEIGERYNLNPYLLMAMIETESSGNEEAVGSGGDSGLMQVNRIWHEEWIEKLGVSDLTDAYSNILVAADYLTELLQENNYNLPLALMKYNMDHGRADELIEQGIYSEYAQKIISRMWELRLLHRKDGETDGRSEY